MYFSIGLHVKSNINPEELILNISEQVPHWQYLTLEEINITKATNGEETITRKHYNKMVNLIKWRK